MTIVLSPRGAIYCLLRDLISPHKADTASLIISMLCSLWIVGGAVVVCAGVAVVYLLSEKDTPALREVPLSDDTLVHTAAPSGTTRRF